MAHASIPVDLFNPGHVFACLGFVEIADRLLGEARGGFDWTRFTDTRFRLSAAGNENPIEAVLAFMASARVESIAPEGTELSTTKWDVPTRVLPADAPYPFPMPGSPATLPVRLECEYEGRIIAIDVDHWGDATALRDNVKFWAGAGGYPGAGIFRDGLDLIRRGLAGAVEDPFALSAPQSSSFRFDWRRDYIPLNVGFSPNEHSNITMKGFPVVELLAAVGLANARPRRVTKLEYRYSVIGVREGGELYDPMFLRVALGGSEMGFPHRDFVMHLGWPGQENQARCITNVIEETGRWA